MEQLEEWELVESNTGLEYNSKARLPAQVLTTEEITEKAVVQGQHENVNSRLKHFNVLCVLHSITVLEEIERKCSINMECVLRLLPLLLN